MATKKDSSNLVTERELGEMQFGAYTYATPAGLKTKMEYAINKELKPSEDANVIQRIFKKTLKFSEVEDKTPSSNVVYSKFADAIQSGNEQNKVNSTVNSSVPSTEYPAPTGSRDRVDMLKNMQDEHQADHRVKETNNLVWKIAGICAAVVGIVAFVIAVIK